MFNRSSGQIKRRVESLEKHLKQENKTLLLGAVKSFRDLDNVAYKMGILPPTDSFTTRVTWWPMISILGTFSSGKSTFINTFLNQDMQRTGNQAVDDKFTVICFSEGEEARTLPGLALDADPRFPFYNISQEIERVSTGEGQRIDAYLQLKTCQTEHLRGKILIDSPGFDADSQRNATLKITDDMMKLSDLVLVFFDARHPEPGAMRDTLEHLVQNTIHRSDSNKFLFILNQIDCTIQDDNLEDVVAAWQRSLAQAGLTAGRFYQIYNQEVAPQIDDESVKARYEGKRAEDMAEINDRINKVEVERAYRIIGVLEHTAKMIENEVAPKLTELLGRWRKRVLISDAVVLGAAGAGIAALVMNSDVNVVPWFTVEHWLSGEVAVWKKMVAGLLGVGVIGLGAFVHQAFRKMATSAIKYDLDREIKGEDLREFVGNAFLYNTKPWRSVFKTVPAGWGRFSGSKGAIEKVLKSTDVFVQSLNDKYTNPSGKKDRPGTVDLEVE
ncbi:MAG: dynamin family protein [Magnetococcales bacterium]|nr:dynamin family protein [Magnetococcales bacterium]